MQTQSAREWRIALYKKQSSSSSLLVIVFGFLLLVVVFLLGEGGGMFFVVVIGVGEGGSQQGVNCGQQYSHSSAMFERSCLNSPK